MRNADLIDLDCLYSGHYSYIMNVAFLLVHPWGGTFKVHIKEPTQYGNMVVPLIVETMEGSVFIVERSWLKAVPRLAGTPPKKHRQPQKGTKPELGNAVAYNAKLIVPGVRVLCRDGKTRTVTGFNDYHDIITLTDDESVWLFNGRGNKQPNINTTQDIMKIIVEPKQDKHNQYEKGVWHFWQGLSNKPPVVGNVKVESWMRCDKQFDPCAFDRAMDLRWKWDNVISNGDIIAFRIVK